MSTALKHRKGTQTQHATFTGAEAEFTYDQTLKTIRVHDGVTAGGFPLVTAGTLTGVRNRFINGATAIDTRFSGTAQTFIAGAALAYCIDRFYGYCTGANVTGQQITTNGKSQYQFTGAAGVTAIGTGQRITSKNSYDFAGNTATFSVNLANSLLTSVTWTAYYANTTNTFGTLASPTRTQIATGTFAVNSTVSRYSAQIAIPAAATTGIEIVLSVGAQTSGTWTHGDWQIELGSIATPFERRNDELEKLACKAYFYSRFGQLFQAYNTAGVGNYRDVAHPVSMRIAPAVSFSNQGGSNSGAVSADSVTTEHVRVLMVISPTTGNGQTTFDYLATAEL